MSWNRYASYVALGSNLSGYLNPRAQPLGPADWLDFAVAELRLDANCNHLKVSSYLQSKPVGPQDQPDFVNACLRFETNLDAFAVQAILQQLEKRAGRIKKRHWGERTLDCDLLHHIALQKNDTMTTDTALKPSLNSEKLILPHPRIAYRNFVLIPLAEVLQADWPLNIQHLISTNSNHHERLDH